MELHALTQAARSYALLLLVLAMFHVNVFGSLRDLAIGQGKSRVKVGAEIK